MADVPAFQAGGLTSGLDSNALIDKLMALEARPLAALQKRQSAYGVRVSTLGTIISKLNSLKSTVSTLGTSGASVVNSSQSFTEFSTSGSASTEGRYGVRVDRLAREAKLRTAGGFSATNDA